MSFSTECEIPIVINGKYEVSKTVAVMIEGRTTSLPQQLTLKCNSNFVSNPAYRVADCVNKKFYPIEECTRGFSFYSNFFVIV